MKLNRDNNNENNIFFYFSIVLNSLCLYLVLLLSLSRFYICLLEFNIIMINNWNTNNTHNQTHKIIKNKMETRFKWKKPIPVQNWKSYYLNWKTCWKLSLFWNWKLDEICTCCVWINYFIFSLFGLSVGTNCIKICCSRAEIKNKLYFSDNFRPHLTSFFQHTQYTHVYVHLISILSDTKKKQIII